ncbi:unnamed protein product [Rhizophagus irregularis]|nr:unnamed protein product [Rhizophagus irregularis]
MRQKYQRYLRNDSLSKKYHSPDEKSDLRAYFVNNSDKRKELELFISEFATVGPVAASSQMTEDLVLNKFIQDLKDTEFDAKTSELLKLAYDTNFFGLDNQPSRMFIRNCYKDLLDIVSKPEIRNLRISGNPGVGKTFFGYYLLYDLLTKDKTIVYELHTMKGSVILFKEDTWYIVDGKKPYNASVAKTILISSPMKSHYHDFDKKKLVSELYVKWGGIPRYILKEALNSSIQHEENTVDEDEINYIAEEYYTETIIKYASDYVGEIIYERLKDSIIRRLQAEVEACIAREKSINNAYFGCYFEQIDEILKFSNVESIENDKYYQPESKTFPSIDAIVAPDKLFQITIATNHPIKVVGMKLLYEKLIKNKEISFYFVVPEKLCGNYQKQNFVTSKGDVSRRLARWIKNHVKQYVLGIDLSSGGSRNLPNLPRTSSTATIEEGVSNLSTVEEPSASIPAKRSSGNQVKGVKGKKGLVSKNTV